MSTYENMDDSHLFTKNKKRMVTKENIGICFNSFNFLFLIFIFGVTVSVYNQLQPTIQDIPLLMYDAQTTLNNTRETISEYKILLGDIKVSMGQIQYIYNWSKFY